LVTSNNGVFYNLNEESTQYYKNWMNSLDKSIWTLNFSYDLTQEADVKKKEIYHVRPVYSSSTGKKIGLLSIEVPLQTFNELINQENTEKDGFSIIKDGSILTYETHNEEIIQVWNQEEGM